MSKLNEIECPIELTLSVISNKWGVLIVRDLFEGTKRFGELQRNLEGISQKVLTDNLKKLEESKLISRTVYPEVPPKVEYSLTPLGRTLETVIDSLKAWGNNYKQTL